jgi:hypothetical protein
VRREPAAAGLAGGSADAAAALVALVPATASAATPCWQELVNDYWADNRVDRTYPISCYREAMEKLREFTEADLIERAEAVLFKIGHDGGSSEMRSLEAILHDEIDKLEELSKTDVGLTGTPSGFTDIDITCYDVRNLRCYCRREG